MTRAHSTRPASGWTGGQYSLYRGLLAVFAFGTLASRSSLEWPIVAVIALGLIACPILAIGLRDRAAAIVLFVIATAVVAPIDGAPLVLPQPDVMLLATLLWLHLFVPAAPFGAWDARDRVDPSGDWRMPRGVTHAAWALLVGIEIASGLSRWVGEAPSPLVPAPRLLAGVGLVFAAAALVALFRTRSRAPVWIVIALWHLAWTTALGREAGMVAEPGVWLLLLLASDPSWLPAALPGQGTEGEAPPARLYYDGDCGFCHRSVRFILSEDQNVDAASKLRFSPLESESFRALAARRPSPLPDPLPDSLVLELEDGTVRTRSQAVLTIALRLGGAWRALAFLGRFVPLGVRDSAYDGLARIRKKIFAAPKQACPLLAPELRARFDF